MAIKSSNQITFTEHKKIIEIQEYYLATANSKDVTIDTAGWTTDIQTMDATNRYLWNYEKVIYSLGDPDVSEPVIIGVFGNNGKDGKGISNIINYYATTASADESPSDWNTVVPKLSPENKFLWNYEKIVYTDNSETEIAPAIIGAYGDSGADGGNSVIFEIYSTQGFMFKEDLETIELKIAAFKGATSIIDAATFVWSWWDSNTNEYVNITIDDTENQEKNILRVNVAAEYALANLKCTMTYDENVYEDYITLTNEIVIYNAVVKFFNGSNIFGANDQYLVAYIDLYQNNTRIETVYAQNYYTGEAFVDANNIIQIEGVISDPQPEDKMYFICKDESGQYYAVLGQYNESSNTWEKQNHTTLYDYYNTLSSTTTNVVVISREQINKSQNVEFTVVTKDNREIASTYTMVIDSNDPVVSSSAPVNPVDNQIWLDTSTTPSSLKIYVQEVGEWVECTEHAGNVIHTSQPTSYTKGDLWVVEQGSMYNSYKIKDKPAKDCFIEAWNGEADYYTKHGVKIVIPDIAGSDKKNSYSCGVPDFTDDTNLSGFIIGACLDLSKTDVLDTDGNVNPFIVYIDEILIHRDYIKNLMRDNEYASLPVASLSIYDRDNNLILNQEDVKYHGRDEYATIIPQIKSDEWAALYNLYLICSGNNIYLINDTTLNSFFCELSSTQFTNGTILKAIESSSYFSYDHWIDTRPDETEMQNNLYQNFAFSKESGLRIGQTNQKFYVNIKSIGMEICEDPNVVSSGDSVDPDPNSVVSISNNASKIKNATFEGESGTTFNNNVNFNKQVNLMGLAFVQETNGSWSLRCE